MFRPKKKLDVFSRQKSRRMRGSCTSKPPAPCPGDDVGDLTTTTMTTTAISPSHAGRRYPRWNAPSDRQYCPPPPRLLPGDDTSPPDGPTPSSARPRSIERSASGPEDREAERRRRSRRLRRRGYTSFADSFPSSTSARRIPNGQAGKLAALEAASGAARRRRRVDIGGRCCRRRRRRRHRRPRRTDAAGRRRRRRFRDSQARRAEVGRLLLHPRRRA